MTPVVTAPRRPTSDRPRRPASARARTFPRRPAPTRPPRRVSGPVGGRTAVAAAPRERAPLGGRALALVRGLPDHSLIDRLVRGRAWIPVLGLLLAGIVAMQVEILKLGSTMGRAMERTSTLQTQNESLQASVAGLADDQRIERLASGMGLTMSTPDSLVFISARPSSDAGRAAGNIHMPDPVGFTNQLAAQAAAAAALMPTAPASTSASTSTSTSASSSGLATSTAPAAAAPSGATTTSSGTSSGVAASPTDTTGASGAPPAASSPATGTSSAAPAGGSSGTAMGPPVSGGGGAATGGGGAATGAAGVAPTGSSQSGSSGGG